MDLITPSIGLIFWNTIIFVILLLFLSKFAWNPIMKFINKREKIINKSFENAIQIKNKLYEIENKKSIIIKKAYEKRNAILMETIKIKENIKNSAKKEALIERNKILNETKIIIDIEKKNAVKSLKNKVKLISIEIAEKILRKKLNNDIDQKDFVKNLIDKL
ncbi:F0F1 ATP synthase subunit B [Blattabacterium cuenoti]|uniref:F0F1 ATP synthase subunit B n=1 Tax=Blattabacterium cuenoti TaxID=1653831 RepID=UPI00163C55CF|nr:F0F1 ATP synthase subunit B [Blattabacterium cuenoti]